MRILVVDDEPAMLKLIATYLRRHTQYEVLTTSLPKQALDIVRDNPGIDVIISDIEMPVMKGPELLQEVIRISPDIKCILISGYSVCPESTHPNIQLIRKPFGVNELLSAIKKAFPCPCEEQGPGKPAIRSITCSEQL